MNVNPIFQHLLLCFLKEPVDFYMHRCATILSQMLLAFIQLTTISTLNFLEVKVHYA